MAEKKHTPEPWDMVTDYVVGTVIRHEGLVLAKMRKIEGIDEVANAKRVVNCVNALKGVEDPHWFVNNAKLNQLELNKIREYIFTNETESTFDEVVRHLEREITRAQNLNVLLREANGRNQKLSVENDKLKSKVEKMANAIKEVKENFQQLKQLLKNLIINLHNSLQQ